MNTLHELLAECDALRARLGSLRPLPVEALKKIEDALNIEYTYESNRIEGNTLTLQETALVVNEGVTIAGKSMREHLEAINHAEAIDYIKDFARNDTEISERTIKEIHAIVLHGIDRENAGRYRTVPVMISGSTHPAATLFDRPANGGLYVEVRTNGGGKGAPDNYRRLPTRRVSTHSPVCRRQRPHVPPADEFIPIAPRLYAGKPQRIERSESRLL